MCVDVGKKLKHSEKSLFMGKKKPFNHASAFVAVRYRAVS